MIRVYISAVQRCFKPLCFDILYCINQLSTMYHKSNDINADFLTIMQLLLQIRAQFLVRSLEPKLFKKLFFIQEASLLEIPMGNG